MSEVFTAWLTSMIDNAPYLVGAVFAITALWRELNKCHEGNEAIKDRLLNHIMEERLKDT